MYGGELDHVSRGEAYIINFTTQNYEILKPGPCRELAGSALKDNKIYVFGGYDRNITIENCDTFDLVTKE